MASNLTTFALYTPALALIAGSGLALRQQGLAALTILLITLMVAWGRWCSRPWSRARQLACCRGWGWMNANNRWIQVVLGFGFADTRRANLLGLVVLVAGLIILAVDALIA